jgi:hypothetical protein
MPGRAHWRSWLFLFILGLAMPQAPVFGQQMDRKTVRDALKQLWESLDTVEFRCDEFNLDRDGRPRRDDGFTRYYIAIGSNGQRAVTVTAVRPEGERIALNFREDGRRSVGVDVLPGKPAAVDKVCISNQQNTREDYRGPMCQPLWIMYPRILTASAVVALTGTFYFAD